MCYNNPRGVNIKGGRASQISRVCVTGEAAVHGSSSRVANIELKELSGGSEVDKNPACDDEGFYVDNETLFMTRVTSSLDVLIVGRVEQSFQIVDVPLANHHDSCGLVRIHSSCELVVQVGVGC